MTGTISIRFTTVAHLQLLASPNVHDFCLQQRTHQLASADCTVALHDKIILSSFFFLPTPTRGAFAPSRDDGFYTEYIDPRTISRPHSPPSSLTLFTLSNYQVRRGQILPVRHGVAPPVHIQFFSPPTKVAQSAGPPLDRGPFSLHVHFFTSRAHRSPSDVPPAQSVGQPVSLTVIAQSEPAVIADWVGGAGGR